MDTISVPDRTDLNPTHHGNVSLAQIQALGLFGYLPPFIPLGLIPNNAVPPPTPLDLSKSGYESVVRPVTETRGIQNVDSSINESNISSDADSQVRGVLDTDLDRTSSSPELEIQSVANIQSQRYVYISTRRVYC